MADTYCDNDVTYKAFAKIPNQPNPIPIMYRPGGRQTGQIQNKASRLPMVIEESNENMAKPAPVIVNGVTYKPDISKIRQHNCTKSFMGNKRVFDYIPMAGGRRRTRRRHGKRKHSTKRKHKSKRKQSTRRRKSCKRRR